MRNVARYNVLGTIAGMLLALPPIGNAQNPTPPNEPKDAIQPDPEWKSIGNSLWFDRKERRLVVRTRVVLREGPLEHFLCLKGTKEHEAILATDAQARRIHAGLLLTGAVPGHPVRFNPKFEPPAGTQLALDVEWKEKGRIRRSDARRWIRDSKTKKSLAQSWVFAGSELYEDPASGKKIYAAEEGDLITVANFGSAILDLPFASSADNADRMFMAETDVIPPVGTEVLLFLKPLKAQEKSSEKNPSKKAE